MRWIGGKRMCRSTVLCALSLALGACASQAKNPFDTPSGIASSVYVNVDNGLFYDVGVYALRGGSRFRIGTVTSHSQKRLKVAPSIVGTGRDFRLQADLIGSRERYLTQPLIISGGEQINWSIVNGLYASQASIR